MKRTTKSLLEELNTISSKRNTEILIESRATHVIDSAINLLKLIKESFPLEQADELERRFLNSIRTGNSNKFTRGIRRIRDQKETAKRLTIIEGGIKEND